MNGLYVLHLGLGRWATLDPETFDWASEDKHCLEILNNLFSREKVARYHEPGDGERPFEWVMLGRATDFFGGRVIARPEDGADSEQLLLALAELAAESVDDEEEASSESYSRNHTDLLDYADGDWKPHTIQSGPRKGQVVEKNETTGALRDPKPQKNDPAPSSPPSTASNLPPATPTKVVQETEGKKVRKQTIDLISEKDKATARRHSSTQGAIAADKMLRKSRGTQQAMAKVAELKSKDKLTEAEQQELGANEKVVDKASTLAEVVTASSCSGTQLGGAGPIDVLLENVQVGTEEGLNGHIDVKLVGSEDGGYTTTLQSDLNKLQAAHEDAVAMTLAYNVGQDVNFQGVYVKLGAGSFTAKAKNNPIDGFGSEKVGETVRLLTGEEMRLLTKISGQRLLKSRLAEYLATVDHKEYRAMTKRQTEESHAEAIKLKAKASSVAKQHGVSVQTLAETDVASMDEETTKATVKAGMRKLGLSDEQIEAALAHKK